MTMQRWIAAVGLASALALGMPAAAPAQDARARDHEDLRAVLRTVTQALNAKDFQALADALDRDFSVTTVDQRRFRSLPEFRAYWESLFAGERAVVRRVTINPTADDLTMFLAEDVGVSTGTSDDVWEFTDGDVRTMKVRWTAVVRRTDGRWKLAAAHVGTNLLDNPVLDAAKQAAWKLAAGLGAAGLVVGALAGFAVARRRGRGRA
jgi:ketosteroid isomerase-like protein